MRVLAVSSAGLVVMNLEIGVMGSGEACDSVHEESHSPEGIV